MSNTISKFANISFSLEGMQYVNRIPVTGADTEALVEEEIQNLVASYGSREFDVVYHYSVEVSGEVTNPMDVPVQGVTVMAGA